MQKSFIHISVLLLALISSSKAFTQETPQLECETLDGEVKISIYGPLGAYYEDELDSSTAMEFTNRVEIILNDQRFFFANSLSISNDFNDYIVQTWSFNSSSRQMENVMSLYFESESEEGAELKLNLPGLQIEGPANCHIRQ